MLKKKNQKKIDLHCSPAAQQSFWTELCSSIHQPQAPSRSRAKNPFWTATSQWNRKQQWPTTKRPFFRVHLILPMPIFQAAVSCFYYFFSFFFNLPDQTFTANRLHTTTARQTAVNVSSIANTAGKADHHDQPLTHRPAAAHRVFFRSSFFSAWDCKIAL